MASILRAALAGAKAALFNVNSIMRLLRLSLRWRRSPTRIFHAELRGVFLGQPLPCFHLHGVPAGQSSYGVSCNEPVKNVERNVPARRAPSHEAAIDVGPERQPCSAAIFFEL